MKKNKSIIVLFLICLMSCMEWDSSIWDLDENYSVNLILGDPRLETLDTKASDPVDVVQIYRVDKESKDKILPLNILRYKQLIYEFREKDDIRRFIELSREIIRPPIEGCSYRDVKDNAVYHIIAYDRVLMRIGYIRYYPCNVKGVAYGILVPSGNEGIFDNVELIKRFPLLK